MGGGGGGGGYQSSPLGPRLPLKCHTKNTQLELMLTQASILVQGSVVVFFVCFFFFGGGGGGGGGEEEKGLREH